jgi:NADH-quinone oxidoreductase subunit J
MTAQQGLFLFFAFVTLIAGLRVVTARNLFHAAIWLVLALAGVAALFAVLDAGLLATVQVLVYIGAISVLIIFAIMLTRGMMAPERRRLNSWSSTGALVSLVLLIVLVQAIIAFPWVTPGADLAEVPADSVVTLGAALVDPNQFVLPFELASVLLLVALIGAIFIARERQQGE